MDVKTAGRVLDLFEAFAGLQQPVSISELARRLKIPVSSCFGLVRTMEGRGYLYAARPRGALYPTLRLLAIARTIAEHDPVANRVTPELEALRDRSGETVLFAKRSGAHAVLLDVLVSQQRIRYDATVGEMHDLHATSVGKALLGQMEATERSELLDKIDLRALTPDTITARARLETEIRKSARRGWYVNAGESVEHIAAVAVPVRINGDAYAVSLVGPMERMKPNLKRLGGLLGEARDRMEDHGTER